MLLAIAPHLRLLSSCLLLPFSRSLGPFPHRPVRPTLSTIYIKLEPSTVKVCGVRSALEHRQVSVRRRLRGVPAPGAALRRILLEQRLMDLRVERLPLGTDPFQPGSLERRP